MLEIRYNIDTKEVTGWCGDPKQFSSLDRERDNEAVVVLDIPIPSKAIEALLFDEAAQSLIDNPDYVGSEPVKDLATRVSNLETKVEKLEKG